MCVRGFTDRYTGLRFPWRQRVRLILGVSFLSRIFVAVPGTPMEPVKYRRDEIALIWRLWKLRYPAGSSS